MFVSTQAASNWMEGLQENIHWKKKSSYNSCLILIDSISLKKKKRKKKRKRKKKKKEKEKEKERKKQKKTSLKEDG